MDLTTFHIKKDAEILYLVKASDDFVSHCSCDFAPISYPGQLDCPWCGCGWLFTCMNCQKAFTFAKAVRIKQSWRSLAQIDIYRNLGGKANYKSSSDWISDMGLLLDGVVEDQIYSYLDWNILNSNCGKIRFKGEVEKHSFTENPHADAFAKNIKKDSFVLADPEYWRSK